MEESEPVFDDPEFEEVLKAFGEFEKNHPEMFVISEKWLKHKVTIQEAEDRFTVFDERLGDKGAPFGFVNKEWEALIAQMIDGDALFEFCSPEESWRHLYGREGIALVRKGEIIDFIYTEIS